MVKKSFKEKEQEFLLKNNKGIIPEKTYIPQKTEREKALEFLLNKGFNVCIKDMVLYCECEDEEEFNKYKSILLEHFNKDGKVAFSFGGSIKNPNIELEQNVL